MIRFRPTFRPNFRHSKAVVAAVATLALGVGVAACGGGDDSRTRNNEVSTTLDEFGNAASTTLFDWQATTTTEGSGTTDTVDPAQTTVAPGPETSGPETTGPETPDGTATTVPDATATTVAAGASTQRIITQSDGADGDSFGGAVALSSDGSTLAVGALYDDVNGNSDQGSVTVFSRSGKNWVEEKVLTQANGAKDDWFGYSVALSSDGATLAVGTVYADTNGNADEGSVSVFARTGGNWSLQKTLTLTGGAAGDLFGYSVALSSDGNTLAAGAISDDIGANVDQGSVSVFGRTGGAWKEQAVLTQVNGVASSNFGWSLSLSSDGNTLAVGGPNQGVGGKAQQGSAAIFTRANGTWS